MSCLFQKHYQTFGQAIPVAAPVAGSSCDCGKYVCVYSSDGTWSWQLPGDGRLHGR